MYGKTVYSQKPGPMSSEQREVVKRNFLQALAETSRVAISARRAGTSRHTIMAWIRNGFLSQEEMEYAYAAYEEILRSMIWATYYVKDSRIAEMPVDFWQHIPTRRLLAMARSVIPEYGGYKHKRLQFNIDNWTLDEQAEIREHIIRIQQRKVKPH
jgi:hypothetical protein